MQNAAPQIVQYQGSKRLLAPQILKYMPAKFDSLIEPFSGLAAISIATAISNRAMEYVINDLNKPIIDMLTVAINNPEALIVRYKALWLEQFDFDEGHIQHFYHVRERFIAPTIKHWTPHLHISCSYDGNIPALFRGEAACAS
jgi:DNA adenine methylase